jgi:predicted metal-dependent hydrolase
MQLVLPWFLKRGESKKAEKPPTSIEIGPHSYPVTIARHRRARRYVLRMTPEGGLRITVPRGASVAGALAFARGQGAWVARERDRRLVRSRSWSEGVWFRGERVKLVLGETTIAVGSETMARPKGAVEPRDAFEAALRTIASVELPARCVELAGQHGVKVNRVTVRNQRSRWGSCSSRGAIALNWRLLQMPPDVSDYVILHELMHVRQPNHSRQFLREVASVCEEWRAAEKWLRAHGRELL